MFIEHLQVAIQWRRSIKFAKKAKQIRVDFPLPGDPSYARSEEQGPKCFTSSSSEELDI